MERSGHGLLRYAQLDTHGAHRSETAGASSSADDAAFARHAAEVCGLAIKARDGRRRNDGARSIEATAERMAARDARAAMRNALDLQRLNDLEERYDQRRAQTLRRRWFVLGRVIEHAMRDDPTLRRQIAAVIARTKLRRDERDLVASLHG